MGPELRRFKTVLRAAMRVASTAEQLAPKRLMNWTMNKLQVRACLLFQHRFSEAALRTMSFFVVPAWMLGFSSRRKETNS